ncbi:hypothetical protein ACLFLI_18285 [Mammaliicoccus sciuri]
MNDRVKSVKFEAHGSEFIFRLGKTCWGDEGIAVSRWLLHWLN